MHSVSDRINFPIAQTVRSRRLHSIPPRLACLLVTFVALVGFMLSLPACGQLSTGDILGNINDPSGAVLPRRDHRSDEHADPGAPHHNFRSGGRICLHATSAWAILDRGERQGLQAIETFGHNVVSWRPAPCGRRDDGEWRRTNNRSFLYVPVARN